MTKSNKHDTLITAVIENMSLQDKVDIANFSEDDIRVLGSMLLQDIKLKYNQLSMEELSDDTEEANAILMEIWKRLRETHRLRIVK